MTLFGPEPTDWRPPENLPDLSAYNTIWFELHEDLLTSLGIDRSQEAQP